jgi:hypothetical protein
MKYLFILVLIFSAVVFFAQTQTFGLTIYTPPKVWAKQATKSILQFKKQDTTKGIYCIITLLKAIVSKSNAKENFDHT